MLIRDVAGIEVPATGSGGIDDCIVELEQTFRFGSESGIRRLADAVLDGEAGRFSDMSEWEGFGDLAVRDIGRMDPWPASSAPGCWRDTSLS
jgi:hypothetical protein